MNEKKISYNLWSTREKRSQIHRKANALLHYVTSQSKFYDSNETIFSPLVSWKEITDVFIIFYTSSSKYNYSILHQFNIKRISLTHWVYVLTANYYQCNAAAVRLSPPLEKRFRFIETQRELLSQLGEYRSYMQAINSRAKGIFCSLPAAMPSRKTQIFLLRLAVPLSLSLSLSLSPPPSLFYSLFYSLLSGDIIIKLHFHWLVATAKEMSMI